MSDIAGGHEDRLEHDTSTARDYRARGMASEAIQALRSHEKMNDLQFESMDQKLKDLKTTVDNTCKKVEDLGEKIDEGFSNYNNKIIALLASIVGLLIGGMGVLVFYLLTKGGN